MKRVQLQLHFYQNIASLELTNLTLPTGAQSISSAHHSANNFSSFQPSLIPYISNQFSA